MSDYEVALTKVPGSVFCTCPSIVVPVPLLPPLPAGDPALLFSFCIFLSRVSCSFSPSVYTLSNVFSVHTFDLPSPPPLALYSPKARLRWLLPSSSRTQIRSYHVLFPIPWHTARFSCLNYFVFERCSHELQLRIVGHVHDSRRPASVCVLYVSARRRPRPSLSRFPSLSF